MKAILQVSTGVYGKCTVRDLSLLRQRLEHLLGILPVRGVIFGWGQIPDLFGCIVETAHRHGAEAYLWMPCFADTDFESRADPLVPWDRTETKGAATCPGETFRFICPSSEKNLEVRGMPAGRCVSGQDPVSVCGVFGNGFLRMCLSEMQVTPEPRTGCRSNA